MVSEDIPLYSACEMVTVPVFVISWESGQLHSSRTERTTPSSLPSATTEGYRTERKKIIFKYNSANILLDVCTVHLSYFRLLTKVPNLLLKILLCSEWWEIPLTVIQSSQLQVPIPVLLIREGLLYNSLNGQKFFGTRFWFPEML